MELKRALVKTERSNINTLKLKKIFFFPLKYGRMKWDDWKAEKLLRNVAETKKNVKKKKIEVAFIVQMPEIWDKEEPIFQYMLENEKFNCKLLVVPTYDFVNSQLGDYGTELEFFSGLYKDTVIKIIQNGKVIDIEWAKFDYVFYQRPYNNYLPKELKNSSIAKYCKVCYVPYAYWPFKDPSVGLDWTFLKYTYVVFMDSDELCKVLLNKHARTYKKKLQYSLSFGSPLLEKIDTAYSLCDNGGKKFRLLWTPRWSQDDNVGGSHFLTYKDDILKLLYKYQVQLTVRPHPLMFENFIKTGVMTKSEVQSCKRDWGSQEVILDSNKAIADTFLNTDILITDISSIMITYYMTGKPIIYCPPDNIEECDTYRKMRPGMYIAHNYQEIEEAVDMLTSGSDPRWRYRLEMINKIKEKSFDATKKIVNWIVGDYEETNI